MLNFSLADIYRKNLTAGHLMCISSLFFANSDTFSPASTPIDDLDALKLNFFHRIALGTSGACFFLRHFNSVYLFWFYYLWFYLYATSSLSTTTFFSAQTSAFIFVPRPILVCIWGCRGWLDCVLAAPDCSACYLFFIHCLLACAWVFF